MLKVQKFETQANFKFFQSNPGAKFHHTNASNRYNSGGFPDLRAVELACLPDVQVPASQVIPSTVPFPLNPLVAFALGAGGLAAQVYMQAFLRGQQRSLTERPIDSAQEAAEPPTKTPRSGEDDSPNSGGLN